MLCDCCFGSSDKRYDKIGQRNWGFLRCTALVYFMFLKLILFMVLNCGLDAPNIPLMYFLASSAVSTSPDCGV